MPPDVAQDVPGGLGHVLEGLGDVVGAVLVGLGPVPDVVLVSFWVFLASFSAVRSFESNLQFFLLQVKLFQSVSFFFFFLFSCFFERDGVDARGTGLVSSSPS